MDRRTNARICLLLLSLTAVTASAGCSLWGRSEVKQYEAENERLLTDFRAQRDRAERLEIEKRALVSRLQDLENRFAAISDALNDPAAIPQQLAPLRQLASPQQLGPNGNQRNFLPASQPGGPSSGPLKSELNQPSQSENRANSPPPIATNSWEASQ